MTDQQALAAPLLDEEEIIAVVTELLDMLAMNAGIDLDPGPPPSGGSPLTATTTINAQDGVGTTGRLTIETDSTACGALAACWGLVGPDGATMQDAKDALGELTNLVGGTIKTVLAEESFVGIPEVAEGTSQAVCRPVPVDHGLGRFVVQFGQA